MYQYGCCAEAISLKFNEPDNITTDNADKIKGISNAIIWCKALKPPMKGYLLLLAQENNKARSGKNPKNAKTAIRPTLIFATTHPGATGISAATAAAVATNIIGAAQNIGLSAPDGTIISLEMSFNPSAINCQDPFDLTRIKRSYPKLHFCQKFAFYEYCCSS